MLKVWNVNSFDIISSFNFRDTPLSCFSINSKSNLIATGHTHGPIRILDLKKKNNENTKSLKSHSEYVSVIKYNNSRDNILASSDYCGNIKIWDLRADLPLYSISCHNESKIFDICWLGKFIR